MASAGGYFRLGNGILMPVCSAHRPPDWLSGYLSLCPYCHYNPAAFVAVDDGGDSCCAGCVDALNAGPGALFRAIDDDDI